jgi:hypothetical protein
MEARRMEVSEEDSEPPSSRTRNSSRRTSDRPENVFLAPATGGDATLPVATGGSRARARSDDEESVVSFASHSSVASTASRGKKRNLACMAPECPKS